MTDHRINPNKLKITATDKKLGVYGLKMEDADSGLSVIHLQVTAETHMAVIAEMLLELADKKKKHLSQSKPSQEVPKAPPHTQA